MAGWYGELPLPEDCFVAMIWTDVDVANFSFAEFNSLLMMVLKYAVVGVTYSL